MSRPDTVSVLSSLIVLGIAAVFAFFLVSIMYQQGLASLVVTLALCVLALLFVAVLTLVGVVLLIEMMVDRLQHYALLRERRELERQEMLARRKEVGQGRVRNVPRHPQIWRIPLNDPRDTGC